LRLPFSLSHARSPASLAPVPVCVRAPTARSKQIQVPSLLPSFPLPSVRARDAVCVRAPRPTTQQPHNQCLAFTPPSSPPPPQHAQAHLRLPWLSSCSPPAPCSSFARSRCDARAEEQRRVVQRLSTGSCCCLVRCVPCPVLDAASVDAPSSCRSVITVLLPT
jgi:hypothetical protein